MINITAKLLILSTFYVVGYLSTPGWFCFFWLEISKNFNDLHHNIIIHFYKKGTTDSMEEDGDLMRIFSVDDDEVFIMGRCSEAERFAFFAPIFLQLPKQPPVNKQRRSE